MVWLWRLYPSWAGSSDHTSVGPIGQIGNDVIGLASLSARQPPPVRCHSPAGVAPSPSCLFVVMPLRPREQANRRPLNRAPHLPTTRSCWRAGLKAGGRFSSPWSPNRQHYAHFRPQPAAHVPQRVRLSLPLQQLCRGCWSSAGRT